jgi:hypothetical protein
MTSREEIFSRQNKFFGNVVIRAIPQRTSKEQWPWPQQMALNFVAPSAIPDPSAGEDTKDGVRIHASSSACGRKIRWLLGTFFRTNEAQIENHYLERPRWHAWAKPPREVEGQL